MPTRNRFTDAANRAASATNVDLAQELARLTPLTEAQIHDLAPQREDKEHLARLLAIVSSAREENDKVAAIQSNLATLGPVAVRVLRLLLV